MSALLKIRTKKRLSLHDVAGRTGVSVSTISELERTDDKPRDPRLSTARKLAECFGVSVDKIFPEAAK